MANKGRWLPHICTICGSIGYSHKIDGVWVCNKHYARYMRNGSFEIRRNSKIEILKDCAVIITANGDKFFIDKEDAAICSQFTWSKKKKDGYARASINGKETMLHRFLLSKTLTEKMLVDHIDGDIKNNRRNNLRACTPQENSRNHKVNKNNKTGVSGVFYRAGKYSASITTNGKTMYLGTFSTIEEAINARRKAEAELYGEYAPSICREGGGYEAWEE